MKCVTAIATDSSHKDVGIILITRICYIDTNCQQVSFTLTQLEIEWSNYNLSSIR
jgi:hypothetical protein